eukprot:Gregarina_sp_Poly_1__9234@NODE_56_length_17373_cov_108_729111_g48_i0_p3_GENE_NODE_56_length_17373_cov_108_729111_g48_i0NODE_56_length_17373_cov_108_729111_g48_i0_p3_ORF_typecomplete_len623_score99_48Pkinase/PF00069_25/1_2e64Pkinase_Tyr/PF07714_17/3_4e34Kinaselike/PF14531_6/5_1e13Kdo/PF06293_14/1_6e07Kdo/PF06293_14/1_1e03Pkinase_fungal/PF17667_1/4_3e06WaaY/PF06176_11/0_0065RIO1/PF01163_22/0_084EcKinase/PF02958_20/0_15Seadorna_VP7/PF07387_11/0_17_NODE_56_length_17373_cov_108_729111_g48_i0144061627
MNRSRRFLESFLGAGLVEEVYQTAGSVSEYVEDSKVRRANIERTEEFDRLGNYILMRLVGRGAYGEVWLANDLARNQIVAVKKLKLAEDRDGFPKLALREIALLNELNDHPNIVKLISVVYSLPNKVVEGEPPYLPGSLATMREVRNKNLAERSKSPVKLRKIDEHNFCLASVEDEEDLITDDDGTVGTIGTIWMVFEFTPYDLHTYIELNEHEGKLLSLSEVKLIVKELLIALEHCHSRNILHRDLKTANLLIDFSGHIKLADFGLARHHASLSGFVSLEDSQLEPDHIAFDITLTNKVVTLWYRPPEILLGSREYTVAADMWSVGCVLYEMVCGKPLFPAENEFGVLKAIMTRLGPPSDQSWPQYNSMPLRHSAAVNPLVSDPKTGAASPLGGREALRSKIVNLAGDGAWDFVSGFLKYNPALRMTASEALKHPWLKKGVAPCLPIDPEKAVLGNAMTLKRDRDRARSANAKQLQKRLVNQPRHVRVGDAHERIKQGRIAHREKLCEELQAALNVKEEEIRKWDATLNSVRSTPVDGHATRFQIKNHVPCLIKKSNGDNCVPPSDSDGLEEGEIASPSTEENSASVRGARRVVTLRPAANAARSVPRGESVSDVFNRGMF